MKYDELRVYKQALEGVKLIFSLTNKYPLKRQSYLVDQLQRASSSVLANIAEGYGRGSKADFARFLSMSIGSTNEIKAHLDVAKAIFPGLEVEDLVTFYESLGKQIWSFRKSLQK